MWHFNLKKNSHSLHSNSPSTAAPSLFSLSLSSPSPTNHNLHHHHHLIISSSTSCTISHHAHFHFLFLLRSTPPPPPLLSPPHHRKNLNHPFPNITANLSLSTFISLSQLSLLKPSSSLLFLNKNTTTNVGGGWQRQDL